MAKLLPKLAIALYLLSLASPCVIDDDYPTDNFIFGIEILLEGWLGVIAGELHWYANLVFFYVIYRAWNDRHIPARGVFSAVLLLPAVTVLFPVVDTSYGNVTLSPYLSMAKEVLFGTYIWSACMLLGAIVCWAAPENSLERMPIGDSARVNGTAVPISGDRPLSCINRRGTRTSQANR